MSYVICEYERVKENFPEFAATVKALRTALIAKAEADWDPLKFAGRIPAKAAFGVSPGPGLSVQSGFFGETTVIPALFNNLAGARLITWNQWLSAGGNQLVLTGAATGGTIYEDYKIGVAGLAFLDKAIRISEIKLQIGDRKLPRINIEEALAYNKPAVVFEEGFILDEETGFDLRAYVTTQGPQRVKLIGLQLNRVYDKLLTNTGAALT